MSNERDLISQLVKALDLDELTQGYRRRLLILDSQIEAFKQLRDEYLEVLADMREMVTQLRALYQINMRVLNVVNAPTETKGPQKGNRNREDGKIKLNLVKPGKGIST